MTEQQHGNCADCGHPWETHYASPALIDTGCRICACEGYRANSSREQKDRVKLWRWKHRGNSDRGLVVHGRWQDGTPPAVDPALIEVRTFQTVDSNP